MNLKIKSIGIALLYCVLFRISFGLGSFFMDTIPEQYYWYLLGAFGTISIILITWIFLRLEHLSFEDIGLKWEVKTPKRFLIGILLGVGISGFMLLAVIGMADLKVSPSDNVDIPSFLIWTLAFIPLAYMEELAFRSYPFLKLQKILGLRRTQVILAIAFSFYHFGEDSIPGIFFGPGAWAFVYGMAAVYSKGIALPTGLHFGTNFILASMGDKKVIDALWTIEYVTEPTQEMLAWTGNVGLAVQGMLLVGALLSMEWYLRRNRLG